MHLFWSKQNRMYLALKVLLIVQKYILGLKERTSDSVNLRKLNKTKRNSTKLKQTKSNLMHFAETKVNRII